MNKVYGLNIDMLRLCYEIKVEYSETDLHRHAGSHSRRPHVPGIFRSPDAAFLQGGFQRCPIHHGPVHVRPCFRRLGGDHQDPY